MNREQIKEFMGANGSEWITDLVEIIVREAVEEDRSQRWLKEKAQLEAEWALLRQMQEAAPKPEQQADPCPGCRMGGVCRTPSCGRLKLPVDHPFRSAPKPDQLPDSTKLMIEREAPRHAKHCASVSQLLLSDPPKIPPCDCGVERHQAHITQPDNTGTGSEAILHEAPELTDERIQTEYFIGYKDAADGEDEHIAGLRAVIGADRAKRSKPTDDPAAAWRSEGFNQWRATRASRTTED